MGQPQGVEGIYSEILNEPEIVEEKEIEDETKEIESYEESLEDIKTSIEHLGGDSVIAFAYPFGHYNEQCKKVLL